MTEFYLIRHGKTEFNVEKRFQGGAVDSKLLSSALEDSKKLGKELRYVPFDLLLTSEQQRAIHTGNIIADYNINQKTMNRETNKNLNEINFGIWEGVLEDKIPHSDQLLLFRNTPEKFDARIIDGEHYYEVYARMKPIFDEITLKYPHGKILIVSHGMALLALVNGLLKTPYSQFRKLPNLDNNSVSILLKDQKEWILKKWNNIFLFDLTRNIH